MQPELCSPLVLVDSEFCMTCNRQRQFLATCLHTMVIVTATQNFAAVATRSLISGFYPVDGICVVFGLGVFAQAAHHVYVTTEL